MRLSGVFFLLFISLNLHEALCIGQNNAIDYKNLNFEHITVKDGLPTFTVNDIIQDDNGFIWFATENGLCRYDAYEFKVFQQYPADTGGLSSDNITCLLPDEENSLWIGTEYGLNRLDMKTGVFHHYFHQNNDSSLWSNGIRDLHKDKEGNIWIATQKGMNFYNKKKRSIIRYDVLSKIKKEQDENKSNNLQYITFNVITEDKKGNLWAGTWGNGIFKIDVVRQDMKQYKLFDGSLEKNVISAIAFDNNGFLHVGSEFGAGYISHVLFDPRQERIIDTIYNAEGNLYSVFMDHHNYIWAGYDDRIYIYPPENYNSPIEYSADPGNEHSLSKGIYNVFFQDNAGNVWISSMGKGVDVYYPYKNYFNVFYHDIKSEQQYRDYGSAIYKDNEGNLWFGTFGDGLLVFDNSLQKIKRFYSGRGTKYSLAGNFVWNITEEENGNVWVATNNGISIISKKTYKVIENIRKEKSTKKTLTHNVVVDILHDSRGYTWVATQEGLDVMYKETMKICRHVDENDGLCNYKVQVIMEDRDQNLWFGTYNGLSCYDPQKNTFKNYHYNPSKSGGISNPKVNALLQDSSGYIWIGTNKGLNKLNPVTGELKYYFEKDGLVNNTIRNLFMDQQGYLWIHSVFGLSRMNVKEEEIVNYGREDELITNNIGMCLHKNMVYIAGENSGFYKFSINDIKSNPVKPQVCIAGIKVNGQPFLPDGEFLSSKSRHFFPIKLKHNQSSIEIEFTALNYISPDKNLYKYRLKGFQDQWVSTSSDRRYAVYNNLSSGEYTFQVKASNNDGIWNKQETNLHIKILPPWWKTWWAFALYFLIIVSLLYFSYFLMKRSALIRIQQEKARIQHETDESKLRFFTNISHEFRTPLTLIYGTLEQLVKFSNIPDHIQKKLHTVFNNAVRMNHLINQVLELRKLDAGKIKPKYQLNDIIPFIDKIFKSFTDLADQHEIKYVFKSNYNTYPCFFDEEKIETILLNLISNAFKHTPDKGNVIVNLDIHEKFPEFLNTDAVKGTNSIISIQVANTGSRIPADEINKLFERFYQSEQDYEKNRAGTGIGLSLVKELVTLLKGTIRIESNEEGVTKFMVYLPVPDENEMQGQLVDSRNFIAEPDIQKKERGGRITFSEQAKMKAISSKKEDAGKNVKKIMLIAEDNSDVRSFIASLFVKEFKIIEVENGVEGYVKSLQFMPDIIISDIMMPESDGIAFCNKIKHDEKTNHIPFILLTAKTTDEYKLEGFHTGADDYVTKPFNSEILMARVNNILANRLILQEYFRKRYLLDDETTMKEQEGIGEANDRFMNKVKEIVNKNMHKEDYSVVDLANSLEISRSQLNRKLKAILNISPSEFIKICRLKKAKKLLQSDSRLTISEVAFRVGYKEASYFSKSFKKHFKKPPSGV